MTCTQTIPGKCAVAAFVIALAISAQAQNPKHAPASTASISQIQSELKRDPNNPHLHVTLGLAYWDRNDYPHALEAFQQAVKVGPSSRRRTTGWGLLLKKLTA